MNAKLFALAIVPRRRLLPTHFGGSFLVPLISRKSGLIDIGETESLAITLNCARKADALGVAAETGCKIERAKVYLRRER